MSAFKVWLQFASGLTIASFALPSEDSDSLGMFLGGADLEDLLPPSHDMFHERNADFDMLCVECVECVEFGQEHTRTD